MASRSRRAPKPNVRSGAVRELTDSIKSSHKRKSSDAPADARSEVQANKKVAITGKLDAPGFTADAVSPIETTRVDSSAPQGDTTKAHAEPGSSFPAAPQGTNESPISERTLRYGTD